MTPLRISKLDYLLFINVLGESSHLSHVFGVVGSFLIEDLLSEVILRCTFIEARSLCVSKIGGVVVIAFGGAEVEFSHGEGLSGPDAMFSGERSGESRRGDGLDDGLGLGVDRELGLGLHCLYSK